MKAERVWLALRVPKLSRRFKQRVGASDIGLNKRAGPIDGSIHMALCGEVHDGVWLSFRMLSMALRSQMSARKKT